MNTLKCNVCNIVIDELLAYIQNKISVVDEKTLKRICVSAFTSSEITKSKTLLYESLPSTQRKILRKGSKKEERDLDDIISVFKSVDPDIIPVFVARVLEKLPPILFDHLDCTKLLKDITKMSSEIAEIKTTYVTMQQFEELQSDVRNMKYASLRPSMNPSTGYVNMKRGAWNMSSGPAGLTLDPNSSAEVYDELEVQQQQINTCDNSCTIVCTPQSRAVCTEDSSNVPAGQAVPATEAMSVNVRTDNSRAIVGTPQSRDVRTVDSSNVPTGPATVTATEAMSVGSCKRAEKVNAWQIVKRRKNKPKYKYLGERGKAVATISSFKAADKKVPIFITNVHNDTVESHIVDYIKEKTQELVSLEKINTKKVLNHKAYKFFVPETKVTMFLDEKIWPEGVIFRRFVHFKNRRAVGVTATDGPLPSNYG